MRGIQVCNKFSCMWMCMQFSVHMDVDIHIGSENELLVQLPEKQVPEL